jgi:hypothetical protein
MSAPLGRAEDRRGTGLLDGDEFVERDDADMSGPLGRGAPLAPKPLDPLEQVGGHAGAVFGLGL